MFASSLIAVSMSSLTPKQDDGGKSSVVARDSHRIFVRFPRGLCQVFFEPAPPSMRSEFPSAKNYDDFTYVQVCLGTDAHVTISGFGTPFANKDEPQFEAWVNSDAPIVDNIALLDVLKQDDFHFIVATKPANAEKELSETNLGPPFSYPYGEVESWDLDAYKELLKAHKGHRFAAAYKEFCQSSFGLGHFILTFPSQVP